MCSEALAEDVIRRLSERVLRQALPIRHGKRMLHILELTEAGLRLLIDGALLPMIYYATAQQIGIAPACPLLPPLQYHLPWSPNSFHAFGWKPLIGLPLLRSISSPAALILGQTLQLSGGLPLASYRMSQRHLPSRILWAGFFSK